MRSLTLLLTGFLLLPGLLSAQDPEGVRLGLLYQSEYQPGLVVLPFAAIGADAGAASAVQAIIARDLEHSDRFQLRAVTDAPVQGEPLNLALWKERGADWVLEGSLAPRDAGMTLTLVLHDAVYGRVKDQRAIALPPQGETGFRMAVHAASDEVVRWATGDPGMAATRIAFALQGRGSKEIYLVDSDGENVQRVTSDGTLALTPTWSADGLRLAYTSYRSGPPVLYERDLRTGQDRVISDREGINSTPAYSPDGRLIAFGTSVAGNTEVATYDRDRNCCLQQQTHGRQFDSFNPTFSPDGRQLAFVSDRLGQPHIYVMDLGGDARVVSEYVYGSRAKNDAPDWSPRANQIVYQTELSPGNHQLMLADLDKGSRRVLTNQGNNETPSWAPDGRHVVFSSHDRDGGGLFVLDTVSGRIRPLLRGSGYGLPDWSRTLFRVAPE
jgi:TolB protein